MKKIALILVPIVIVLIILPMFFIGSIVKSAVEDIGGDVLGVPVSLGNVSLSIFNGEGSISDITLGNPKGFSEAYSVKISNVSFAVDISSLLSDTVVVKQISVLKPHIIYELSPKGSNISRLSAHSKKEAHEERSQNGSDAGVEEAELIIEQLLIQDGKVTSSIGIASAGISLPRIEMKDLGKKNNQANVEDIISHIMDAIVRTLSNLNLSSLKGIAEGTAKEVTDQIKGISDGVNSLFGN